MYTISRDYYAILGVSKDASFEEIKRQFKRLMKEHHPDQYNGLKAKYVLDGDRMLLKILEDKIKDEEEFCKLLNEAFGVLSDSAKRKQYDNETIEPKVEDPKIVITPKTISFGTLKNGEKKSSIFTIKNNGGPAIGVNIDWEGLKPDWGELVIEPDENTTFPIKVTVSVDTKNVSAGPKDDKIVVTVDGKVQTVEVFLSVRVSVSVSFPASSIPTTPAPGLSKVVVKRPNFTVLAGIVLILIVGCLVIAGGSIASNAYQQQQQSQRTSDVAIANANASATANIISVATQNSANATSEAYQPTADAISITRFKDATKIDNVIVLDNKIQFRITNQTGEPPELNLYGCGYGLGFQSVISPGQSVTVSCDYVSYSNNHTPEEFYFLAQYWPNLEWRIYPYTGKLCFLVGPTNKCPGY